MTKKLDNLKVGDVVNRWLCGELLTKLKVTKIDDKLITCGAWTFDKKTGVEIDEDLEWGNNGSGSYIEI